MKLLENGFKKAKAERTHLLYIEKMRGFSNPRKELIHIG